MHAATRRNLNPADYYRLPWSLTDNGISWLEVTAKCNLSCEGCYRDRKKDGHKSLEEIAEDLAVFKKERKSDAMSIAGGDPLVHPQIVEIVRMVKEGGWKPILNTNGLALTPKLLKELKKAGAFGFTFHIDTSQKRSDCDAKTELGFNELRERFMKMLAAEGGLGCAFNQTVNNETISEIPKVVRWAKQYPEMIHAMVFILYREPRLFGEFDFYAHGKKVKATDTYEETKWGGDEILRAADVVAKIREEDPEYSPSGYLNGTVDPASFKWLIGIRVASGMKTYGYITPKFMELMQQGYHFIHKKWLSYSSPKFLGSGKLGTFLTAPIDKGMRKLAWSYLKEVFRRPKALFQKAYFQSFTIIQPIDLHADGQANMCDGCPDITVYKGKLYWSCRLEEIKEYGCFLQTVRAAKPELAEVSASADRNKEKEMVVEA